MNNKPRRKKTVFIEGMGLRLAEILRRINVWILRVQYRVGRLYSKHFTFKLSLALSMIVGACFAFVGDDCQGKITFSSPMVYCLFLISAFFFFQTFIMVPLNIVRATRMICVAVCGHYLAYQSYGLWSLEHMEGANVCKPYTYANITYGYAWLFIPALLLVLVCFLIKDGEENLEEDSEEEAAGERRNFAQIDP